MFKAIFNKLFPEATLIELAVISLLILAAVGYFFYSQNKIQSLQATALTYQVQVAQDKDTIAGLTKDVAQIQSINKDLNIKTAANTQQAMILDNKLMKLADAAKKNPGAVEKIINQATKDRFRCFALATGSPPLKNEVNKVCPQLLPVVKSK